ncbi:double-cubane-cluster-containing anaerobic reductase [Neofamilia massiliensis]|uniref:double-cubane-cluster-containing anaerobic reductase n=1 Tax=Neofamilia massiliensis TaxID=1673724 RepID=UPI0006BB6E5C|nr:double-cubane-cluster-containing anaerobic reductase [Neofamilia massiliensis]
MKIIKDLPEIFEEFADQRKNSFLAVKEYKDKNIPVVGSYCTYFPREIAEAAGAATVSLCSTSDETIAEAEKDLPKNLCPLIKSSYGFAKADKCPFFYFSDVVVGETTCDGKKKMYELMSEFKPVFLMELPNSQSERSLDLWVQEVIDLKNFLEEKFETEITDEKLLETVKIENNIRKAMKNLAGVMKADPTPISGYDLFKVLYGSTFKLEREKLPEEINALAKEIVENPDTSREKKPRILVTGCPLGGATEKIIKAIEDNGAVIVSYENCTGEKNYDNFVDENADDLYRAIARRYLDIGCSVMTPDQNRFDLLSRLIDEYKVDGVVEMNLQACHTYAIESHSIRKFITEEKNIPFISIETDYSQADIGQLNTRVSAFIEML